MGIFDKGDGLQLVIEEPLMPKNSKQPWIRSKTYENAFFTLSSPESDFKIGLTGTLKENGKNKDGDTRSEPSLFLLDIGCQDERRCRTVWKCQNPPNYQKNIQVDRYWMILTKNMHAICKL